MSLNVALVLGLCAGSFSFVGLSAGDTPLRAENLYNGVNRSASIVIEPPGGSAAGAPESGVLQLALMNARGELLLDGVAVTPGTIDLAELMPDIWRIRKTCYLQLVKDGEPVGSALVLQPMLNRPPIWTERATRPDGRTRYTRIVGWGNEPPAGWKSAAPPATPPGSPGSPTGATPPPPAGGGGGGASGQEPPAGSQPPARPEDAPEEEEEAFTGLRIYPERDVVIETSKGDIVVALVPSEAPNTAWNFRHLAENGFYTEVIFHRIVPFDRNGFPFVIQGGDPSGTGSGGPGYWLPIEPSQLPHDFGVISMARSDDPDSAGSQFFFGLSREGTARLDGQYCAFGYAVKGAGVIRAIADEKLADVAAGRPENPPVIYRMRLIPSPPRTPGLGRLDRKVSPTDDLSPTHPNRVPR